MLRKTTSILLGFAFCAFAFPNVLRAQAGDPDIEHLTIYNAGIGEFLEERMIMLQPGMNAVEWRSLMPKANIRTVRVIVENAEVLRQDVTFDGIQVNNERSPVLHLIINNRGPASRRLVQVDYLAPNISWRSDFSLVLDPTPNGEPPTSASFDSWVSISNNTGTDLNAGTVDLVAGEIALLPDGGTSDYQRYANITSNQMSSMPGSDESGETSYADISSLSAFNRFTLGTNINLNANVSINRFPIFQGARLVIEQRNIFENTSDAQTLARGGFIMLPRGLEVRLIAKNTASAPLSAGLVTIYQRTGTLGQVVGQDRIQFTPQNGEFTVTQGRSATLFGTRRIVERRVINYRDAANVNRDKLVTQIEIVLTNRGGREATAFVREGIERYDNNEWKIVESSIPNEPLGSNMVQFKVTVPANGKTTITYTVENE
ncbi:MAG: hypothetical protein ACREA9_16965 [Pyrinomonadaceae bacterium]